LAFRQFDSVEYLFNLNRFERSRFVSWQIVSSRVNIESSLTRTISSRSEWNTSETRLNLFEFRSACNDWLGLRTGDTLPVSPVLNHAEIDNAPIRPQTNSLTRHVCLFVYAYTVDIIIVIIIILMGKFVHINFIIKYKLRCIRICKTESLLRQRSRKQNKE